MIILHFLFVFSRRLLFSFLLCHILVTYVHVGRSSRILMTALVLCCRRWRRRRDTTTAGDLSTLFWIAILFAVVFLLQWFDPAWFRCPCRRCGVVLGFRDRRRRRRRHGAPRSIPWRRRSTRSTLALGTIHRGMLCSSLVGDRGPTTLHYHIQID